MRSCDLLAQGQDKLKKSGVSNGKLDSLILLTHALSVSKEQIIFNPNVIISPLQQEYFFGLIDRRCKHEPVSQIIAKREFYGYDFIVTSDVLDPRPDSESLIELVLQTLPPQNFITKKLDFLELGVGSGCLIITLLKLYQTAIAIGADISLAALEICQKNSIKQEVNDRLLLVRSDLFSAFSHGHESHLSFPHHVLQKFPTTLSTDHTHKKFDLIISNPPYIKSHEIEHLQDDVKNFEPHLALDGGVDGLDFYRRIAKNAEDFLVEFGYIIIEIGAEQKDDIVEIFTTEKFIFIESKKDLAGIDRALCFKLAS